MNRLWGFAPTLVRAQAARSSKIIGTMGPACTDAETFGRMVEAGLDIARLNFSHGSHDDKLKTIELIREVERQKGRPIAILMDLCGPKVRTTKLKDPMKPIILTKGSLVTLESSATVSCDGDVIGTIFEDLYKDLKPGHRVMLSDGKFTLKVESVNGRSIRCRVVHGGKLQGSQGINVPDAVLSTRSVTAKDLVDLNFGLRHGCDMVAVSFVQSAADIHYVKQKMTEHYASTFAVNSIGGKRELLPVISKIEVPQAVVDIDSILEASECIMVARGDLGVELPSHVVPIIQKKLVGKCNGVGKPVIVATQMLESMINSPTPTRAEVSDVSNAIFDGADACMLSGETSVGQYPVESVEMMARIAEMVSENYEIDRTIGAQAGAGYTNCPDTAVAQGAARMSEGIGATAVVVTTRSGATARKISAIRPRMPIVAITVTKEITRQLLLCRGVLPVCSSIVVTEMLQLNQLVHEACLSSSLCKEGDKVVVTGGHPLSKALVNTNFVKVMTLGAEEISHGPNA